MRIDLEGKRRSETQKGSIVTDGKRLRMESTGRDAKTFDAPETLGAMFRTTFARGGLRILLDSFGGDAGVKGDPGNLIVATEFKMGAKEKVGARDAQAVECCLEKNGRSRSEAAVWIDLETHLPLKRTLKMGDMTVLETFSDFKLDEKIDPAKFELPKENK